MQLVKFDQANAVEEFPPPGDARVPQRELRDMDRSSRYSLQGTLGSFCAMVLLRLPCQQASVALNNLLGLYFLSDMSAGLIALIPDTPAAPAPASVAGCRPRRALLLPDREPPAGKCCFGEIHVQTIVCSLDLINPHWVSPSKFLVGIML